MTSAFSFEDDNILGMNYPMKHFRNGGGGEEVDTDVFHKAVVTFRHKL
jgi:hypothetical protein